MKRIPRGNSRTLHNSRFPAYGREGFAAKSKPIKHDDENQQAEMADE
jgi:hypothetical protein